MVAAASRGRRQRAMLVAGNRALEPHQERMPVAEQHVDGRPGGLVPGQGLDGRNCSNKQVADYPDHALVKRRRHGRGRPIGCPRIGIVVHHPR